MELRKEAPVNIFDPAYYLDSYSGDIHREEYRNWKKGEFVLLEFAATLPQSLTKHLQSSPTFVEDYEPQKGKRIFVFRLPEEVKEAYTFKILGGKYSEADRKVVDRLFPNDPHHSHYGNRLILEKSDVWKKQLEKEIGVSLADGAEVYSKPFPRNEVYGYYEDNSTESTENDGQRTPIIPTL